MEKHAQHVPSTRLSLEPANAEAAPQAPDYLGTWHWRSRARGETIEAWAARVDRQEAEVKSRAAAWLQKDRKVRVICDPFPVGQSLAHRIGVIDAPCRNCFSDYVYVRFEAQYGAETNVRMLGLECLAPLD